MNPLDLPGPEFLGLYVVLLLIAVAVAALLRWALRLPNDEPAREMLDLSPYEVAYLAGREELAVNAAMARLIQGGVLAASSASRKLNRRGEELPPEAPKLEREVLSSVDEKSGETIANVRAQAGRALEPIRRRLGDLGLLVPEDGSWKARWIPVLVVLSVALLGVLKIVVGLSRDKPVSFLVILCVITVAALVGFARPVHRSRRGDRALERLKEANAALEYSGRRHADDLAGDDLVLAVGLFGMGVLAGGPLADLQTALKPPRNSSGCGGGCGSSGCGGGGCGGGCGGGGCGGCGG